MIPPCRVSVDSGPGLVVLLLAAGQLIRLVSRCPRHLTEALFSKVIHGWAPSHLDLVYYISSAFDVGFGVICQHTQATGWGHDFLCNAPATVIVSFRCFPPPMSTTLRFSLLANEHNNLRTSYRSCFLQGLCQAYACWTFLYVIPILLSRA